MKLCHVLKINKKVNLWIWFRVVLHWLFFFSWKLKIYPKWWSEEILLCSFSCSSGDLMIFKLFFSAAVYKNMEESSSSKVADGTIRGITFGLATPQEIVSTSLCSFNVMFVTRFSRKKYRPYSIHAFFKNQTGAFKAFWSNVDEWFL